MNRRAHSSADSSPLAPGLYIVATPIGNARDITLRALEVLAAADVIACEDTRVTAKLLALHGIATQSRLTPYNDHNAPQARPKLLAQLQEGARIALASDAGTPLISDPGYRLVCDAREAGIAIHSLPGPSAAITALTLAGLPTDRFLFLGFLPSGGGARRSALAEIADVRATLVLYESTQRLGALFADAAQVLGAREAAVCRELTKLHEEVVRGSLAELAARYAANAAKGEAVVLIGPPDPGAREASDDAVRAHLIAALAAHSVKDAAAIVAAATGRPRQQVYALALTLRDGA